MIDQSLVRYVRSLECGHEFHFSLGSFDCYVILNEQNVEDVLSTIKKLLRPKIFSGMCVVIWDFLKEKDIELSKILSSTYLKMEGDRKKIHWLSIDPEHIRQENHIQIMSALEESGVEFEEEEEIFIPEDETSKILYDRDIRIAFTNFDVNEHLGDIETCPGVDYLEVKSRYSFQIVVGKLFNFSDVRRELISRLGLKSV